MIVHTFAAAFRRGLRSGRYAPIDIIQVVQTITRIADVLACLDRYCQQFDPAAWPPRRQMAHENTYRLAQTIGGRLLLQALAINDPTGKLPIMIRSLPSGGTTPAPDSTLRKRAAVYAKRFAVLDTGDRDKIVREAQQKIDDRNTSARRSGLLLDVLAADFKQVNKRPHANDQELLNHKLGTDEQRKAFEQIAMLCEKAWTETSRKHPEAYAALDRAFRAYSAYLDRELRTPLDLFRVLAWARAPSEYPKVWTVRGNQLHVPVRENRWGSVWVELYLEAARRGLHLGVTTWNIDQMVKASARYVGKDAAFIELPFDAQGRQLLRHRLERAFKPNHADFTSNRRRAALGARRAGIELLNELQSRELSERIRQAWQTEPWRLAERFVEYRNRTDADVRNQKYWINLRIAGAFTVLWVEGWPAADAKAIIEVDAFPGFYFRASAARLSDLHRERFFRELGENARALGEFLLAYLQFLGFVFDVMTAGAGGSLRHVIVELATDYLVDAATDVALDIAHVKNPWARMAIGAGVGLAPRPDLTPTPVRSLPELGIVDAPRPTSVARGLADPGLPKQVPSSLPLPDRPAVGFLPTVADHPARSAPSVEAPKAAGTTAVAPSRAPLAPEHLATPTPEPWTTAVPEPRSGRAVSAPPKTDKFADVERTAATTVSARSPRPKGDHAQSSPPGDDAAKGAKKERSTTKPDLAGAKGASPGRGVDDGRPGDGARGVHRPAKSNRAVPRPIPMSRAKLEHAEDMLDEAEQFESYLRKAKESETRYENPEADKTVAFSQESGFPIFSGSGRTGTSGTGFVQVQSRGGKASTVDHTKQGVARYEELSGHPAPRHGQDNGISGSYYAHHAEVKDRIYQFDQKTNGITAVSKPMCPHCRQWFQRVARERKTAMIVVDAYFIRRFNPDGSVDVFYSLYHPGGKPGRLATRIKSGVPPTKTDDYHGSAW